ncbi:DUF1707 domain-containing protein [Rhodococcus rhodochrous]|uniref:DUF1707 SHOCT-like domain-containing protein n=1 Tax=Rhodococcus rhodochrous TaxID=1829 RepID=UPI00037D69EE
MEHTSTTGPGTATPPLRISDAERETIVDELGRHLTAGRLTIAEFDERVARVYRAATQDDAGAVLADLPSTPDPTPPPPAQNPLSRLRLPLHQRIE